MKVLISILMIIGQVFFGSEVYAYDSMRFKADSEALRKIDVNEISYFLNPEVTEVARVLQEKLRENPTLSYDQIQTLPAAAVTIVFFVAARTYGDYIRGNGGRGVSFQSVEESIFDLN